jgi:TrmH family RNA methyltransferase
MLSRAQNKYIRSLSQQKYRKEHNVFIAEGDKIAREWLGSDARIQMVVTTEEWSVANRRLIERHSEAGLHIAEAHQLEAISALQTPNQVLLVIHMPEPAKDIPQDGWCLALDDIQDPGNMGTIIRVADWFGINYIACSPGCVDVYNPKVVQSAMGSHLRVNIRTADLEEFIPKTNLPVFAATLGGENIYELKKPGKGIIVIGNESKGVSEKIQRFATNSVTIPRIGGAESLNAGVSTGIICALLVGGQSRF